MENARKFNNKRKAEPSILRMPSCSVLTEPGFSDVSIKYTEGNTEGKSSPHFAFRSIWIVNCLTPQVTLTSTNPRHGHTGMVGKRRLFSSRSPCSLSLCHCVLNQDRLSCTQKQSPWSSGWAQQKFISHSCFMWCISL